MEKKDKLKQAIKNIETALNETKFKSNSFKKSDFLSGAQLARKFDLDKIMVQDILLHLYKSKFLINVNGRKATAVYSQNDLSTIYLHPLAIDIFKQYIDKQKD